MFSTHKMYMFSTHIMYVFSTPIMYVFHAYNAYVFHPYIMNMFSTRMMEISLYSYKQYESDVFNHVAVIFFFSSVQQWGLRREWKWRLWINAIQSWSELQQLRMCRITACWSTLMAGTLFTTTGLTTIAATSTPLIGVARHSTLFKVQ